MSWTLEVEQPFGDERIIRCYVLHNGLRAIIVADDSAPIFSYQTWLGVGSRDEQRGRSGMAHFFEHLMFGETEAVPRGEFDRLIEGRGGDNNAATWNEWTYYRTSLPASDLDLAARLESDRMRHLILEDQQIEIEREVVLSERKERIDDDLDGFLDETLCRLAFTEHPYGRPTIGWAEDIRGLSKPDIQAFYRTFYAPNNAVLVLCGDIDEENALAVLDRYYGDMEPAEITRAPLASEPEQRAERRLVVNRPVGADRIAMGYKVPGQSDSDWVVLELIAGVLSGAPSARAYRRLVVDTQM
ncbi:MAG: pitrilysin family protein, partial [Myxococcota bacterium]